MCIFTNGDFKPKGNADRKDKRPKQKRTDRKSLNIYSNFEEEYSKENKIMLIV